ncbi:phosphoadenosine phosphosulfate reductase family protein [Salinispora arenicola]|uniref:phosphoadenosine phosphosulfate reductase domain-containing protein n=1 Tax=Salinispora arenicola TaxID=168697 RepID=UPI00037DA968|nr:phosphoadenosine phosphosulfate reductase family protein [Salinispora arenicola]
MSTHNATPASAAPYMRALARAKLPDWLDYQVKIKPRRKTIGLVVEPRTVTIGLPPTNTPDDLIAAITRKLALIEQAASAPGPATPGWLGWYDVIIIHTSGGKDSQTAVRRVLRILAAAGLLDRVAVLHLVLDKDPRTSSEDPRIEWQQVPELAAEQAARAGIPLSAADGWALWDAHRAGAQLTDRTQWAGLMHYARRDVDGDLLDDFATRRKRDRSPRSWATKWTRYCTSDWKSAVGRTFTETICAQIRTEQELTRPTRVLQVMGFRAEESDDRADRAPFSFSFRTSTTASRHVWEWLPIHDMTKREVWADIRDSGVPYHPAYGEGLSRLSCRLCIMGSKRDLAISKRMAPATAAAFEQVEAILDDPFQHNRPLASIPPAPGPHGFDVQWTTCPTCSVPVLANTRHPQMHCPAHAPAGPWLLLDTEPAPIAACQQGTLFDLTGVA